MISSHHTYPAQLQGHEDRDRLLLQRRTLLIIGHRYANPPRCMCREEGLSAPGGAAQAHRIFWHGGYDKAKPGTLDMEV